MASRRHRLVGAVGAAGALLALSAPAPAAHADWDDLLQPLLDAISWVDPGIAADTDPGSALASLDTLFNGWYQDLVYNPLNSIAPWLFGPDVAGSAADYGPDTPLADLPTSFTVPMDVNLVTQPVINVSVGGGPQTEVLVDTGAAGLVMPIWNINPFGITGLPTGFNIGQFGGYLNYFYLELPTTVTFTGFDEDDVAGTVTADTSVAAVLFAFPADFNIFGPWSIHDYLAGSSTGILGIGPNALGPTPDHIPTADLPGELGRGVLIDQPNGELIFGAQPAGRRDRRQRRPVVLPVREPQRRHTSAGQRGDRLRRGVRNHAVVGAEQRGHHADGQRHPPGRDADPGLHPGRAAALLLHREFDDLLERPRRRVDPWPGGDQWQQHEHR